MSGFNWFQRSFDKSDGADAKAKAAEAEAAETAKDSGTTTPQLSSEDYLKWAKAAYQNIQKQQQTTAEGESGAIMGSCNRGRSQG
jgi:fused signal recognition particle receptor